MVWLCWTRLWPRDHLGSTQLPQLFRRPLPLGIFDPTLKSLNRRLRRHSSRAISALPTPSVNRKWPAAVAPFLHLFIYLFIVLILSFVILQVSSGKAMMPSLLLFPFSVFTVGATASTRSTAQGRLWEHLFCRQKQ